MSKNTSGKQATNTGMPNVAPATSQAELWMRENAEALAERRAWIEVNGTPLADLQVVRDM